LGWRSTRLCFAYPELFQTQLRAILRAAQFGNVGLLLPMISTLEEVRKLRAVLDQARVSLAQAGLAFCDRVRLGVMIEVPAAAICIRTFLDEIDFVSIGSNDLIQYVMAADRDNPKVAHLCEPFHPAIFHMLGPIIEACNQRGTPITLCGEMAGRPRCLLPLLGLGLRRLSVSPAFISTIKELIRRTSIPVAQEAAAAVLQCRTSTDVLDYLTRQTLKVWPDVALLDTTLGGTTKKQTQLDASSCVPLSPSS
jgi:phosphoenolpyruvate-protein phosphotransferase (PTS system enzyme I)